MRTRAFLAVIMAGFLCGASAASAQQQPSVPAGSVAEEVPAPSVEPIPEWLYGEVAAVNVGEKNLQIKYIDFDKDIEKQATVYVDKQTMFSNVASLEDLKPQDIVNVDYVIDSQGKNIALAISVEKPEDIQDMGLGEMPGELKDVQPLPGAPESAMPEGTNPQAGVTEEPSKEQ